MCGGGLVTLFLHGSETKIAVEKGEKWYQPGVHPTGRETSQFLMDGGFGLGPEASSGLHSEGAVATATAASGIAAPGAAEDVDPSIVASAAAAAAADVCIDLDMAAPDGPAEVVARPDEVATCSICYDVSFETPPHPQSPCSCRFSLMLWRICNVPKPTTPPPPPPPWRCAHGRVNTGEENRVRSNNVDGPTVWPVP